MFNLFKKKEPKHNWVAVEPTKIEPIPLAEQINTTTTNPEQQINSLPLKEPATCDTATYINNLNHRKVEGGSTYINNINQEDKSIPGNPILSLTKIEVAGNEPYLETNKSSIAHQTPTNNLTCRVDKDDCNTNVIPTEQKDKPFPLYHPKSSKEGVAINSLSKHINFRTSKQQQDYLDSKAKPGRFLRHLINMAMESEIEGKKISYNEEEFD